MIIHEISENECDYSTIPFQRITFFVIELFLTISLVICFCKDLGRFLPFYFTFLANPVEIERIVGDIELSKSLVLNHFSHFFI